MKSLKHSKVVVAYTLLDRGFASRYGQYELSLHYIQTRSQGISSQTFCRGFLPILSYLHVHSTASAPISLL